MPGGRLCAAGLVWSGALPPSGSRGAHAGAWVAEQPMRRTRIRFSLSRENIFHGRGVFGVSLTPFAPGSWQRRRRPSVGDPAVSIQGGRDSRPLGPKTSRTQHACGLRRPRSAEQGGCAGERSPGRSRYSFVPRFAASRKTAGSSPLRERPVRQGSRRGRVVRRFLLLGAAVRRGSGGRWDGASAPSPHYLRRPCADLVYVPRPTCGPRRDHRGR
jgi:hypothetical protein